MTRTAQITCSMGLLLAAAGGCGSEEPGTAPSAGGKSGGGAGGAVTGGVAGASGVSGTAGGLAGSGGGNAGTGSAPATGGVAGTGGEAGTGGVAGTGGGGGPTPICGTAAEGQSATLSCPQGLVLDAVTFASYGNPSGSCGSFVRGTCDSGSSTAVVEALCLGRSTCTVAAANGAFGDPCNGTMKSVAIQATCGASGPSTGTRPFKGVANSPCAARTALGVSWYYNWTQSENEPCGDGRGGTFVPMIWGHTGNEQSASGIANSVNTFVSRGHAHVLGFNEPDNPSQANIPAATAISLWPSFDNAAIQIGSPATAANANPGQAWFTDFMTRLDADPDLRADFLAVHWYGWNAGSCDANASQLESYINWVESFPGNRPIWITEWGCLNQSAPDVDTVVRFYNGALAVFARHPRIERYAWYPWATNCGLNAADGSLTPLGVAYAAAPAYR